MYDPIQDGIDKRVQSVNCTEAPPAATLTKLIQTSLVALYYELNTISVRSTSALKTARLSKYGSAKRAEKS
jgi:hypothetical protein